MKDLLAIDIGSNTIKSLYASCVDGGIVEGESLSLPIRITKSTSLVDDASEKISYAIKYFMENTQGDFDVRAVATSAMRGAENSEEICKEVYANTGVAIDMIAGHTEAYLSALGAVYDKSIKCPEEFVFMDLGGGSLELAFCFGGRIDKVDSFPLGAVRLTEKFVADSSKKIPQDSLDAMGEYTKEMLCGFDVKSKFAVGTGGAIAAAKYILEYLGLKSFAESLALSDFKYLLAKVSQEDLATRIKNYGISENRADIIPASFVCLISAMESFGVEEMLYANQSLRRGICADFFKLSGINKP